MKRMLIVAVLLGVVLAGCTELQSGQQTDQSPAAVSVAGPECTISGERCGSGTVTKFSGDAQLSVTVSYEGSSATATGDQSSGEEDDDSQSPGLGGENTIRIPVSDNGRNILVAKCNDEIAKIRDNGGFTVVRSGPRRYNEWAGGVPGDEVGLRPGEELALRWRIDIVPDNSQNLPELGYSCPLDFELNFSQTLKTAKQVQIKANDQVPDATELDTVTTADNPVRLRIEAPDSIVKSDSQRQRGLTWRAYLQNTGPGEIKKVKDIAAVNSDTNIAQLEGSDPDRFGCSPNDPGSLRVYGEGPRSGQSYRKRCTVPLPTDEDITGSSVIKWLAVSAGYHYRMNLGTKTIQVTPVEG